MKKLAGKVPMAALALAAGVAASPLYAAPAALVEDVSTGIKGVQVLDYASTGQVIDLGANGRLSLGYLGSCVHENITGGKVTVGDKESQVQNGKVDRSKVSCDGGRLMLSANQASQSGAVALRTLDPQLKPSIMVYDVSPYILLPKPGRVVVKRLDITGERHTIQVDEDAGQRPRLDLATQNIRLVPGGKYMVSVNGMSQVFQVATEATQGEAPLVSKLVPF